MRRRSVNAGGLDELPSNQDLRTEFDFELPRGYVDPDGVVPALIDCREQVRELGGTSAVSQQKRNSPAPGLRGFRRLCHCAINSVDLLTLNGTL